MKTYPGIIVRHHLTFQRHMVLLKERYAEWKKVRLQYCCNQVWMKNGGRIPWCVTAVCETFKISCLILTNRDSAIHVRTNSSIWFDDWKSPYFCQRPVKTPPVRQENFTWNIHRIRLVCGGFRKGDTLVADIEELERMDTSENHDRRNDAKEVTTPKSGKKITVSDEKVKLSGGDQVLRNSTLSRESPERGEEREDLRRELDGSPPPQDSSPSDGEARNDFWSISGKLHSPSSRWTKSRTLRVERWVIPNSTTIHWRSQGDKYDLG